MRYWSIAFTALLLLAHSKQAAAKAELHIYVQESYSNFVPAFESAVQNTAKHFADHVNQGGGVLGKKIKIIVQNDNNDPSLAIKNAETAIRDPKHLATIFPGSSGQAIPLAKMYARARKLMLTVFASSPRIMNIGPTVIQMVANDKRQGAILANVASEQFRAKRVHVLINRSDPYSEDLTQAFINRVTQTKASVTSTNFIQGSFSVEKLLSDIKAAKPDLLFVPQLQTTAAQVTRELEKAGLADSVRVLGSDGWEAGNGESEVFFSKYRKKSDFSYFYTVHWDRSVNEKYNRSLVKRLKKLLKRNPQSLNAVSWVGLANLIKAVEVSKSTDNVVVADQIRQIKFHGTLGQIRYRLNQPTIRGMVLVEIKPNSRKVVKVFESTERLK